MFYPTFSLQAKCGKEVKNGRLCSFMYFSKKIGLYNFFLYNKFCFFAEYKLIFKTEKQHENLSQNWYTSSY